MGANGAHRTNRMSRFSGTYFEYSQKITNFGSETYHTKL